LVATTHGAGSLPVSQSFHYSDQCSKEVGSVIYVPNLQIAHCLRQISCWNLIDLWIAWQVWVDFSWSPSLFLLNLGIACTYWQ
jgi:hypothetical protein